MFLDLNKFILLLWKNCLLLIRHPILTAFEIVFPILVYLYLEYAIYSFEWPHSDAHYYEPYNVDDLPEVFQMGNISWSPCGNPSLVKIMENVVKKLNAPQQCYNNSKALVAAIKNYTEESDVVGVQFEDILASKSDLLKNMKIKIRFPYAYTIWDTDKLFPRELDAPREVASDKGGDPNYFQKGFLTLQKAISYEIINNQVQGQLPQIEMRRFPEPQWNPHNLYYLQPVQLLLAFMFTFASAIQDVALEKQTQVKEMMKIMGLTSLLYWSSWFVHRLLIALIPITVIILLHTKPSLTLFELTHRGILFVLFVLYVSATITFAFAISGIFSKSYIATSVGVVVWSTTAFLPASTVVQKLFLSIFPNGAMRCGIEVIKQYEINYKHLNWSNLFLLAQPNVASLTMAAVMVMLLIDTGLYLLIALYIEKVLPGEFGLRRVWYFPFTKAFWCGSPNNDSDVIQASQEGDMFEEEPRNLEIGIKIIDLKKKFKRDVVVNNISLNIYQGHITVLLGHNGAGKTTTMLILTGTYTPTSGTVIINGYNIKTDMEKIRKNLGFCSQQNTLFNNLTVWEHFYFFCRLKGLQRSEARKETARYIELLDLVEKKSTNVNKLSGGMKRKLCLGIALCGKSKICIIDEPTSGIDPSSRRKLWDLLQTEKNDRTILLSTHVMDEADILGDRIAILANGILQCCGTSFFLKKKYKCGYRLIIVKSKNCDVARITKLLSSYIPTISLESDVGYELTYNLPEDKSSIFKNMLGDVESSMNSLGIDSYGVALSTMEDVFMRAGVDQLKQDQLIGNKQEFLENKSSFQKDNHLHGVTLYMNQVLAMILKKALLTLRSLIPLLFHIAVPLVLTILNYLLVRNFRYEEEPNLDFTLDSYSNPTTVVTTDNTSNIYYNQYKDLLRTENRKCIDWGTEDMSILMMKKATEELDVVRKQYIIGATFSDNAITAWFNGQPYHSSPLALQYVINSIVETKLGSNYSIQFSNHPVEILIDEKGKEYAKVIVSLVSGHSYAVMVACGICFTSCFFVLSCIKERACNFKHMQLVSGLKVSVFWLVSFAWDYIIFLFMVICVVILQSYLKAETNIATLFTLLMIYGFAMLPMVYLISFLFTRPSRGYTLLLIICFIPGFLAFTILQVLMHFLKYLKYLHMLLLCFPFYCLISGVHTITSMYNKKRECLVHEKVMGNNSDPLVDEFIYTLWGTRCWDLNYFSMEKGIGKNIICLIGVGIVLFTILLLKDYNVFNMLAYSLQGKAPQREGPTDSDVLEEQQKVRTGEIKHTDHKVVVKDLTKYFGKVLAVNQLCLGIKDNECFGLLGINGAGKTTTFQMLTGAVKISYGDAWIVGVYLKKNMRKVYKRVGYCPQFDALVGNLTGRETLIIFGLIRGIRLKDCGHIADKLGHQLGFYAHMKKKIHRYSGGNKRKLNAALALIGDPPVIFLDEPSTGMDPVGKRLFWNTLCNVRDNGTCLVLVSHSMEECEAICTRVTIMVNGTFRCLGSPQHLKNKFSDTYVLFIKIKRTEDEQLEFQYVEEVQRFVKENFSNVELDESHKGLLRFLIRDAKLSWSKIFGTMERAKTSVDAMEDYSLSQFNLEQIFMNFTKAQVK